MESNISAIVFIQIYLKIVFSVILIFTSLKNVDTLIPTSRNKLVSYSLPEARELKIALGFDEDVYLNFTELVSKYGFRPEQHTVTTEDGYILTAFRILPKCNNPDSRSYPVLLVNGILDTSDIWILPGPDLGLGYILASNCYDVWVANHRGNNYSRRHIKLDPNKDAKYWNYSFDEHGNYDVPAFIDYILRVTEKSKLLYVGHSQGTTDFFAMASLKPDYNQRLQLSIQIAPVAIMKNIYSPIPKLLASNVNGLREFLEAAGFREILGRNHLSHLVLEILCHFAADATCGTALALSTGHELGSITPRVLSITFGHVPSGTSVKSLVHYAQLITSKRFRRFDEGPRKNVARYGTKRPPDYNLSRITSPVVLISAHNDWLSSIKDTETLSSKLPNFVENYVVPVQKWSHSNHLLDERAKTYVYPKIMEYLDRYSAQDYNNKET